MIQVDPLEEQSLLRCLSSSLDVLFSTVSSIMAPYQVFVQTWEEEKRIGLKIASHDAAVLESARSSEPEMEPHSFMDTVGFQQQVSVLEQHALNVLQNFTDEPSLYQEAPSEHVGFQKQVSVLEQHALNVLQNFTDEPSLYQEPPSEHVGFQQQVSVLEQHALNVLQNFTDEPSLYQEAPSEHVRLGRLLQETCVGSEPARALTQKQSRSKRKSRSLISMAFKAQQRQQQQVQMESQVGQQTDREAEREAPSPCATNFCPFCGGQTMAEFKFCRFCGKATSTFAVSRPTSALGVQSMANPR